MEQFERHQICICRKKKCCQVVELKRKMLSANNKKWPNVLASLRFLSLFLFFLLFLFLGVGGWRCRGTAGGHYLAELRHPPTAAHTGPAGFAPGTLKVQQNVCKTSSLLSRLNSAFCSKLIFSSWTFPMFELNVEKEVIQPLSGLWSTHHKTWGWLVWCQSFLSLCVFKLERLWLTLWWRPCNIQQFI